MQTFEEAVKQSHCYRTDEWADNMLEILEYVHIAITAALDDYENFDGIDFSDVGAGGIQIRGHHKDICNYTYGESITLKYDASNYEEVIDKFVEMWKLCDNPIFLSGYKEFLDFGNRYGWD